MPDLRHKNDFNILMMDSATADEIYGQEGVTGRSSPTPQHCSTLPY